MSFAGFYTRNETVQLWASFVNLDGTEASASNVTVELYQGGVQILSPTAMNQIGTSNDFYYDYIVSSSPTEGSVYAVFKGDIDSITVEGSSYFKIDLIKDHVKETRLGNQRFRFFPATSTIAVRNVAVGTLDYQIIDTKFDDDPDDWSVIRSSKTIYFTYQTMGDYNPIEVATE